MRGPAPPMNECICYTTLGRCDRREASQHPANRANTRPRRLLELCEIWQRRPLPYFTCTHEKTSSSYSFGTMRYIPCPTAGHWKLRRDTHGRPPSREASGRGEARPGRPHGPPARAGARLPGRCSLLKFSLAASPEAAAAAAAVSLSSWQPARPSAARQLQRTPVPVCQSARWLGTLQPPTRPA